MENKDLNSLIELKENLAGSPSLCKRAASYYANLKTPAFVIDMHHLEANLKFIKSLSDQLDIKILLAQKAFSAYASYPMLSKYLAGTCSSGINEAKLAKNYFKGGEIHVFSPAFSKTELEELLTYADHLVVNSWRQLALVKRIKGLMRIDGTPSPTKIGIRINPEYSTTKTPLYDPCSSDSRFGIHIDELDYGFSMGYLEGVSGMHFHCLCEQGSEDLLKTWEVVKEKFDEHLWLFDWINLGGGHHLTHPDYNVEVLAKVIKDIRQAFGRKDFEIYMEPGEAVALNTGFLVSKIVDILPQKAGDIYKRAILDMSPTCHTPDVLEMPYQPQIQPIWTPKTAFEVEIQSIFEEDTCNPSYLEQRLRNKLSIFKNKAVSLNEDEEALKSDFYHSEFINYIFGGPSCLAGDVLGKYQFDDELLPGDFLVMGDMAIYSMVKTNTFNGINLPNIYFMCLEGDEVENELRNIVKIAREAKLCENDFELLTLRLKDAGEAENHMDFKVATEHESSLGANSLRFIETDDLLNANNSELREQKLLSWLWKEFTYDDFAKRL